jgi:hypothetical protein
MTAILRGTAERRYQWDVTDRRYDTIRDVGGRRTRST